MTELVDDNRLLVLGSTRLLDSAPERSFDRLTRLASRLLHAPIALMSLVDEDRQFFKSAVGLGEPWASRRETPLTHSFCQYAVRDRTPLIVGDARNHPFLSDSLAIRDLNVIAYAGIPLIVGDEAIGAFCVADDRPRDWTQDELQLLNDLAESAVSEIELRLAMRRADEQRALTHALIEGLGDGVLASDPNGTLIIANASARRMFALGTEEGKPIIPNWTAMHGSMRADGSPLRPEDGALRRGLGGERTDGLEFTLKPPDASEPIWVEATGRPVLDRNGWVIASVAVYRDVTERKKRADLYKTLARHIPRGAVILFDQELHILAIDGALVREDGGATSEMLGRKLRQLAGFADGDPAFDPIDGAYRRTLAGESLTVDMNHRGRVLALHTAPIRDVLGRVTSGIVLALDVTHERLTEAKLKKSEQIHKAIVQHLPNGAVFMVDRELRYVAAEGPAIESVMRNANLKEMVGQKVADVASSGNREQMFALYAAVFAGESRHVEIRRNEHFYDMSIVPLFDGEEPSHALVFLYDVTARKAELVELEKARRQLEEKARQLEEASVTDVLTGVLNRRGFMLLAEQQMKLAARRGTKLLLVFIDLNGMKKINDQLGHEAGDRALVDMANLLRGVFRDSDVIARLGGDEFVVLATDAAETCGPSFMVRLQHALAAHNKPGAPYQLSFSAGTSVYDPKAPATLDQLLSDADAHMYAQKRSDRPSSIQRVKLA